MSKNYMIFLEKVIMIDIFIIIRIKIENLTENKERIQEKNCMSVLGVTARKMWLEEDEK